MFCFVLLCVFFICPIYKDPYQDSTSGTEKNLPSITFLDTQVSLAPTLLRLSVRRSHVFGFPFCQRLWYLTKRRDDIAMADMVADLAANVEVHMVADMELDKLIN